MKHLSKLDKYRFLNEIYNYELNPNKFTYIGKSPSMVVFVSPDSNFCLDLEPALEIIAKRGKPRFSAYYVNTAEEPEVARKLISQRVPVIYMCPVGASPTVVSETINVRELLKLAQDLFGR
ncbi:MAG: hypothetical protein IKD16_02475 [Bacteroidales bacterium]|nr:hypothetical protein [Bacteroidales bacterium]